MKKWTWQLYSIAASVITMGFVYAIVNLPLKDAVIPAVGLVVLLIFLLNNPIGRYLHLVIFVLSSWVGVVSGTAYRFRYFHENFGEAYLSFKTIEWYVHLGFLAIIIVLLVFDYISRRPVGRPALTKNRLKKYQYELIFYSFLSLLVFFLVLFLISQEPEPIPEQIEIVNFERKVDFSQMRYEPNGEKNDVVVFWDTISFSALPLKGNYIREFQVPPGTGIKVFDLIANTEVTPPSTKGGKQAYGQVVFKIDPDTNQAKIKWVYSKAHSGNSEGVGFSSGDYLVRNVNVTYIFPKNKGICGKREFKPPRLESICRRRNDGFECANLNVKSAFRELWNWNIWSECSNAQ